jgi:hypothetical protein
MGLSVGDGACVYALRTQVISCATGTHVLLSPFLFNSQTYTHAQAHI